MDNYAVGGRDPTREQKVAASRERFGVFIGDVMCIQTTAMYIYSNEFLPAKVCLRFYTTTVFSDAKCGYACITVNTDAL